MGINFELLLNIPIIYEKTLYSFALKKIFDFCSLNKTEKFTGKFLQSTTTTPFGINQTFSDERLEFLGDGLLQSVVTELIFESFPNEEHGALSSLRSRLVRNSTLAQIVKKMGIVQKIMKHYNVSDDRLISLKNAADTFEALIGASFIDRGYEETRTWIRDIYAKHNVIQQHLNEDNYLDILQIYTKSCLPRFKYDIDNQIVTISTTFQGKYYESKNRLKQRAKQDVVEKIVRDLIDQKLLPANILQLRGVCGGYLKQSF